MNAASEFCAGAREIARHALGLRQLAVFHVQLHQRLRMLGHEGDRHHQDGHTVGRRLVDRMLRAGIQPFLRRGAGLVADRPVQVRQVQSADRGGDGALDLELVGIAALDDGLRQAVGREQHPQSHPAAQFVHCCVVSIAHALGRGGDVAGVRVVAAQRGHRRHQPGGRRGLPPRGQRGPGRGGGVLRIERQQHDLLRRPVPHPARDLVAERMPVAHGDEAAHVVLGQCRLQAAGLLLRQPEQGGAAAEDLVVGGGRLGAGIGR